MGVKLVENNYPQIKISGKEEPEDVGNKKPGSRLEEFVEMMSSQNNSGEKDNEFNKGKGRVFEAEEYYRPESV